MPDPFTEHIQSLVQNFDRGTWYHSIRLNDGTCLPGLIPIEALDKRLEDLGIPRDLRGKRVLDLGAATGFNSFELERRGAEVLAVDYFRHQEFEEARRLLGSRVEYVILDVEECTPARLGTFDLVLFLGVLYHCRHPLLALERVCALSRECAFIESYVTDVRQPSDALQLTFYEADELGGQIDNWYGPTMAALEALCRSAGFCTTKRRYVTDERLGLACFRKWRALPQVATKIRLSSAVNNRTNDVLFSPFKDEYVIVYFESAQSSVTSSNVFVEIDDYGVRPITVQRNSAIACQAALRLPPGLAYGEHRVRVRTESEDWSEPCLIQLQATEFAKPSLSANNTAQPAPVINRVENNLDFTNRFRMYRSEALCVYFDSASCKVNDTIEVRIGSDMVQGRILSHPSRYGWQVNVALPATLLDGEYDVSVRTPPGKFSEPAPIVIKRD